MQTFTAIVYNGFKEEVFRLDLDETLQPHEIRANAANIIDAHYADTPTGAGRVGEVDTITLVATGATPVVIDDAGQSISPTQL